MWSSRDRPRSRPIRDTDSQELNKLTTRRIKPMTMVVTEENRLLQSSACLPHSGVQSERISSLEEVAVRWHSARRAVEVNR